MLVFEVACLIIGLLYIHATVMLLQINTGGVGFYRTVYPQNMLDAMIPAIKNQTMPPRDRLGLQNNLFALVFKGSCSLVVMLRSLQYVMWTN